MPGRKSPHAVTWVRGVPFTKIAEALESFRGARRRFEIKYRSDRYMVVDDYGHHPSEVKATLATARNTGRKRVLCMFQPHRYSRTEKLKAEFGRAFHHADLAIIADVYAASEVPIPGVSGQTIVDEMRRSLATELLENTHMGIDQVAERVGFADATSFRKAFKKWTNRAPSAFRAQASEGSGGQGRESSDAALGEQ